MQHNRACQATGTSILYIQHVEVDAALPQVVNRQRTSKKMLRGVISSLTAADLTREGTELHPRA